MLTMVDDFGTCLETCFDFRGMGHVQSNRKWAVEEQKIDLTNTS